MIDSARFRLDFRLSTYPMVSPNHEVSLIPTKPHLSTFTADISVIPSVTTYCDELLPRIFVRRFRLAVVWTWQLTTEERLLPALASYRASSSFMFLCPVSLLREHISAQRSNYCQSKQRSRQLEGRPPLHLWSCWVLGPWISQQPTKSFNTKSRHYSCKVQRGCRAPEDLSGQKVEGWKQATADPAARGRMASKASL